MLFLASAEPVLKKMIGTQFLQELTQLTVDGSGYGVLHNMAYVTAFYDISCHIMMPIKYRLLMWYD